MYKSIKNSYSFTFFPGGLGESALLEPQCFCTDLSQASRSSIIKVYNDNKKFQISGYCQKIKNCGHCENSFNHFCKIKILK